jgi:putative ABC transport system permease protein
MIGGDIIPNLFSSPALIAIILLVALLTGILSGMHPSYVITRFNPVSALKQKLVEEQTNGISLKKVLVTIQFSISIFLLAVGFIVFRQSKYMVNKEMGFESHNILFANIITNKTGSFETLRKRLLAYPEIKDACQSDYIPFILPGGDELNWEGAADPEEKVFVRFYNVSYDFVSTFDMKIVQGRDFSRDYRSDFDRCLENETAIKVFGWKDIAGRRLDVWGKSYEVVGVIKDHVAFSVHNKLEPHLYKLITDSIINDRVAFSLPFCRYLFPQLVFSDLYCFIHGTNSKK